MSKILRAVNFYRNEKDRLNAYTLQLIQVDIIIEKQTSFFIQIITPERGRMFDNQIAFKVSKAAAEENFRKVHMAMRSMIQPEREVWTCGKPAEFPTIEKGENHD
ncbi:hypothetical protein [uncultured Mitsuokella sp.]|uniref:hypothetical protein n=1 Tax=uncultured Mitsuokella sp. TaxID=453120 RepID=UPI0025858907|nr:hypothetical protein [uncultured Mitsuokella sp.]